MREDRVVHLFPILEGPGFAVSASGLGSGAAGLFHFGFRFRFQVPVPESVSDQGQWAVGKDGVVADHNMHRSVGMVVKPAKRRKTLQGKAES